MTKIATWNVNSLKVRLGQVLDWLAAEKPDVLALQETKTVDESFPVEEIEAAGYRAAFSGQKTYNGVATLSLAPGEEIATDLPGFEDPQRRFLASTIEGVRVVNVYVPNGQEVGSEKYAYKLDWLEKLTGYLAAELCRHPKLVVLGDFNIAPEDRDVHDPEQWRGKVLCSDPERAALGALLELGLSDLFRRFDQEERLFSWWDYRMLAFRRNHGLRIDLILGSKSLAETCTACRIDKEPRRLERPSDHTPVVAEFGL
jgi:exodeoxyribonuclease-3